MIRRAPLPPWVGVALALLGALDALPAAAQQPVDSSAPAGAAARVLRTEGRGCGVHCGTERWAVKTLSDSDRSRVQMQPVATTIEALVALARPLEHPAFRRLAPVETTVYQVQARITWFSSEADGDYHLVLASPEDTTITMIAEVPNPHCAGACASGLASTYAALRQELVHELNSPHSVARPLVRVTGVGFFDFLHGQRGRAPNAIELHPVLTIEFP